MESKDHWEKVYATKATDSVSWFQEHASQSLKIIQNTGVESTALIIDVGGGASTLVDDLLSQGYKNLTVLDLSDAALAAAKGRLGNKADGVQWIEGDITKINLPKHAFDVWHDRAVFHFLTSEQDRATYVKTVSYAVKPGGHVIIATFAEDGPTQCSGLPIVRYSAQSLHSEFGELFELLHQEKEAHHTPFGTVQNFIYCYCRKVVS